MASDKKASKKSSADKKQKKTSATKNVEAPLDVIKNFLEQQGEKSAASKLEDFAQSLQDAVKNAPEPMDVDEESASSSDSGSSQTPSGPASAGAGGSIST